MPYCDVCRGEKTVNLAVWPLMELSGEAAETEVSITNPTFKEFPCPQCCMVPFKRVRATKVTTTYPASDFAKLQMPIERGLAARFGEYLYREGLIKFTTEGSADFGPVRDKIAVTAHLGVVAAKDVKRAGSDPEVALTPAPPLPDRLRERIKVGPNARRWKPPVEVSFPSDTLTDEFDEPKDALGARFSGLEIE